MNLDIGFKMWLAIVLTAMGTLISIATFTMFLEHDEAHKLTTTRPPVQFIPESRYRKYLTQADSLFDNQLYDPASKLYAEYSLAMRYRNEANIDTKQADNRRLACELILLLSSGIQSTVSQK